MSRGDARLEGKGRVSGKTAGSMKGILEISSARSCLGDAHLGKFDEFRRERGIVRAETPYSPNRRRA
jgi:hypothetical protein